MASKQSEFLRVTFCDVSGGRRCRVISKETFDKSPQKGVGLTMAVMGLPIFEDVCVPNGGVHAVGEIELAPVPNTIVKLPWHPKSYAVLANMLTHDKKPWELCPRGILIKSVENFRKEFELELDVGYEIEFQLFNQDDTPFNDYLYCSTTALEQAFYILEEIYNSLREMGIHTTQLHKESAPGQYEFALQYSDVLDMCDKLILARDTICAIALKHNLKASFIPKWSPLAAGNGNHAHVSFRKAGSKENVFPDGQGKYGISLLGQHFLSGVLRHLPVLTNFTVPSPNSFTRLQPSCWSGAFTCWGLDNREAPLRLTSTGDSGAPTNFELKLMDASGNPYVAMAALMTAGMDGLRGKLLLPDPVNLDPVMIPEAEREKRGIVRLPTSTGEAVRLLETAPGDLFRGALGPAVVKLWVAVRKREGEAFDKCSIEEQSKALLYRY